MARNYPRFLLSHATEGKSTGYFIVNLREPRMVFKFEWVDKDFTLENILSLSDFKDYDPVILMKEARDWTIAQIISGKINKIS